MAMMAPEKRSGRRGQRGHDSGLRGGFHGRGGSLGLAAALGRCEGRLRGSRGGGLGGSSGAVFRGQVRVVRGDQPSITAILLAQLVVDGVQARLGRVLLLPVFQPAGADEGHHVDKELESPLVVSVTNHAMANLTDVLPCVRPALLPSRVAMAGQVAAVLRGRSRLPETGGSEVVGNLNEPPATKLHDPSLTTSDVLPVPVQTLLVVRLLEDGDIVPIPAGQHRRRRHVGPGTSAARQVGWG
uniref:Uncharacterized protein n=1 Tax=uncultured marine virus TaxID=186617 RepID=A0A0F7L6N3_9VIRU|nr:hypothetical protein [uncultured marine virus]